MAEKRGGAKERKTGKNKRPKMVRDSFTMPEFDYARLKSLKARFIQLGLEMKKSEVLRAGLLALEDLTDSQLQKVAGEIERIKTGRPPTEHKS